MTTIIDALAIELNLNTADMEKALKRANDSFAKTRDDMVKGSGAIEQSAKGMTDALGKATQGAFDLFAAFLGGRGLKEFIENATQANTALGNLSLGLGNSPQAISAWGMAAARMGGSAATTQASIQGLSNALIDLRTQGKSLPLAMYQLSAGGRKLDFQHGWEALAVSMAKAAHEMAKVDPDKAKRLLTLSGVDPVTADLMIRKGPALKNYLEMLKQYAPNKHDIDTAERMTDAQAKLHQQYDLLATKISTALGPALIYLADKLGGLIDWMTKFAEANPKVVEGLAAFAAAVTAVGFLAAIKNVWALRSALLALTEANVVSSGGGLIGLLGRLGLLGAGGVAAGAAMILGADGAMHPLNDGEDEIARQRRYGHGSGNDAIRRRSRSGGRDLNLGAPGKLSDNQRDAYKAARAEGWNETAARALVANLTGEGLPRDAHRKHWDSTHFAQGIAQWSDVRSEAIKQHFGKYPMEMSIADQMKALSWEIRNKPEYARTRRALEGGNAGAMVGALVDNFERPGDVAGGIGTRSQIYRGLGGLSDKALGIGGAAHVATMNSIANDNRSTNNTSSNAMHVGTVNVNAPQATDAHGIARHIDSALASHMFAHYANYGPY